MIKRLKKCYKKAFFNFLNKRNLNFEKHACQNMVALATLSHGVSDMSNQIVAR